MMEAATASADLDGKHFDNRNMANTALLYTNHAGHGIRSHDPTVAGHVIRLLSHVAPLEFR